MTTGTIRAITPDWSGDTLAAATSSSSTVLVVEKTIDFDEDGGWLTVADSAPIRYLEVDDDANTITLATAVGAVYAAGEPVREWDPAVPPAGANVVDYLATVELDNGSPRVVVPHELIPLTGSIDNLIGATVSVVESETPGRYEVGEVFGREPNIDPGALGSPLFRAYLAADGGLAGGVAIPTGTDTTVDDWTVGSVSDPDEVSYDPTTGRLTLIPVGSYLSVVTAKWLANTSGRREIDMISTVEGVDSNELQIPFRPDPDSGLAAQQAVLPIVTTQPRTELRVRVFQSTGASLALDGTVDGRTTSWRVVRLR